ncbi:hypothetical protein HDU98_006278 [Podochytrium sp. JEL0797]|nr:hypothetical protein HDU98_006278 [Podochytrium sp. JEL0797]
MHSNITIGLINWYCFLPGIEYSGPWARSYDSVYNASTVDFMDGSSSFIYVADLAAAAAVAVVNGLEDVLPKTYVNVKRFTDCGEYWPDVESEFRGKTTGYAMAEMAVAVGEEHGDVVGVVGSEYSPVTVGAAEVLGHYQIPYCSTSSPSPLLSDPNNYPYFFRVAPSSGIGNYLALLYTSWNVRRVAFVWQHDGGVGYGGFATNAESELNKHGIEVIDIVYLPTALTEGLVEDAVTSLRQAGARFGVYELIRYFLRV